MILKSLKYSHQKEKSYEWTLSGKDDQPVEFGNTNLIVGKNAAGKSRTLTAIAEIANVLALKTRIDSYKKLSDWAFELILKEGDDLYEYSISVFGEKIIDEVLVVNGEEKVNRRENKIYSETIKAFEELDITDKDVVILLKDNEVAYPYLSEIHEWGSALKRFTFTNQVEKSQLLDKEELERLHPDIDPDNVILLFHKGQELFGESFTEAVLSDMKRLDYNLKKISLDYTSGGVGISVDEEEVQNPVLQTDMSQGMFRALAFTIQLNIALLSKVSVCLLIDDLGEGLDFARSKSLIDILIYKINNSDIQLFITTNDRYIMNAIPIKYWSILERQPKKSKFYNYYNSQETFEDFKYTGLSNFDFLATDFYRKGFEDNEHDI
ncbi:MAG: ATP-binding protein [Dysgonomonas sp.]|nr:ATP-binding protein [Dysgonomonas sp.]